MYCFLLSKEFTTISISARAEPYMKHFFQTGFLCFGILM